MKNKLNLLILEIRYHLRVLDFLGFKQKISYLFYQVIQRDCKKRENCLTTATLKRLSTNYNDELSNYAFHCVYCHREAERALQKWRTDNPPTTPRGAEVDVDMEPIQEPVPEKEAVQAAPGKFTRRSYRSK